MLKIYVDWMFYNNIFDIQIYCCNFVRKIIKYYWCDKEIIG